MNAYIIQKGYRRLVQTEEGWQAQEKLFWFWFNTCVYDLNGVSGTIVFSSLRNGLRWLDGKRVTESIKY